MCVMLNGVKHYGLNVVSNERELRNILIPELIVKYERGTK